MGKFADHDFRDKRTYSTRARLLNGPDGGSHSEREGLRRAAWQGGTGIHLRTEGSACCRSTVDGEGPCVAGFRRVSEINGFESDSRGLDRKARLGRSQGIDPQVGVSTVNAFEWLQLLLSYAVQLTLVIVIAWCLEARVTSSKSKSKVWTGSFAGVMILFASGFLLPRLQLLHPWTRMEPVELLGVVETQFIVAKTLLTIWLIGIAAVVVHWIWQFSQIQRFIRSARQLSAEQTKAMLTLVPGKLKTVGNREVCLYRGPEDLGPFCYQFHQPMVFLPDSLVDGDNVALQHVLLHELTHLHTAHPMQLFLQKTLQAVFWFHPLVWSCGRRVAGVREFVCDEAVASDRETTIAYLRTLLQIVENSNRPVGGTLSMGRTPSELKQRAKHLSSLGNRHDRGWVRLAPAIPIAVAIFVSQLWLPTNPLASSQSQWSRWPQWSAAMLHSMNVNVRDYERFDPDTRIHELLEAQYAVSNDTP